MKILLANKYFYPKGGSETVFFHERDFLIRQGHQVIDFSMKHPQNVPSQYADHFIQHTDYALDLNTAGFLEKLTLAVNFVHNRRAIASLRHLIETEKPDIAHLHNIYHQLTPAIIPLLKEYHVKVLLTLHDAKLICPSYLMFARDRICEKCQGRAFYKIFQANCQQRRSRRFLLAVEAYWHKWRQSYELVDLFLSPSQFLAEMMERYRLPQEKIVVLKNGVAPELYSSATNDDGYALYFGRLSKEKGVETLLQAHELTQERFPLKIVGAGPLEAKLRKRFKRASFLGYRTGAELMQFVANAAFVVAPSEWYENCSLSILEAMASGKPVIGSKIGGIPEQIDDGVSGLLFEKGNVEELAGKMTFLAENSEIRKQMGRRARQKLEQEYRLETHHANLLNIYKRTLLK